IFIHNLPEGIAIGIGALPGFNFSILIALAIAIHDIPEAICVAAPLYYSTGKKFKSFLLTFLTVIPTIAGFLLTYYFFKNISGFLLGLIISATAGVMLYISFWELLPEVMSQKGKKLKYLPSFLVGSVLVLILQILFK
ncbi:ZIP family metal transporter, partial [Patescibacteria group bacterium]|nr:ZIP family metal transporter [Patescibacteria group bacterium]